MINFELVMVKLSVNINKIATIRNARGGNTPDLIQCAKDIESFGAHGITVHPRPDERHIRYEDVYELSKILKTEFNIEGNPNKKFIDLVLNVKPAQVTLVPDDDDAITSNSGWNTKKNQNFLKEINSEFTASGIRTSIFVDPINEMVEYAKLSGADRIELYTENYAINYLIDKHKAILPYVLAAKTANKLDLEINAGHDLNLNNLNFFSKNINKLHEVSIGHSLISDSLYHGFQKTIKMYLNELNI